ncbi:MAG: hypothetical protein A2583_04870 [Bdellovibrionales bacterium RIFOXYD1_FULL_53_11]|nr:MAG: hypothetical protein A2583_04870 [Bdellovibrionales bacterium RIFOXYD1_FULL_53_11]
MAAEDQKPAVGLAAAVAAAAQKSTVRSLGGQKAAAAPVPAPSAPVQPVQTAAGPQVRKLKKGDLLFAEGEMSRAMYFLKTGVIRIFKKKGESSIEIDTIRAGQVLGELAFLDGNPRSASGEALTICELVEVSGPTFQAVLAHMPDWLKILLKTIVGRLRTASTRIRQLEQASTSVDYGDKDGKGAGRHYVYLSPYDVLKIFTAVLLVGARNAAQGTGEIKISMLLRYANQIMGVPAAKVTSLLDILAESKVVSVKGTGIDDSFSLDDPDFLERALSHINEQNLLEPSKRQDVSVKSFMVMSFIAKHLPKYPKDEKSGQVLVNLADILQTETGTKGKEPFRMDEFPEIIKYGYIGGLSVKSASEVITPVDYDSFMKIFRMQKLLMAIAAANEQKRAGATAGKSN